MDQIVKNSPAAGHAVVSREAWLASRKQLLAREKAYTRLGDELSAERRALPWVRVDKDYAFEGPDGRQSLADLFAGRSQLFVYHFMMGPDWKEGCKSCSYVADHFDGTLPHLAARDVTLVAVSRAAFPNIAAFKARMGWQFPWLSSYGSDFNFDFGVSFTSKQVEAGDAIYNFGSEAPPIEELHGAGVFFKDASGTIYHTYSTYGRGLDAVLNTYTLLDMVPKGRDEENEPHIMAWVRHHDKYEHVLRAGSGCCGG
jgi:predicted dithiol-disulfide oxidoreductase (DUF899 family)